MNKITSPSKTTARNKQARNYDFLTQFVAGVVLEGSEVKWVKQGKVNLDSSYVRIRGNEAWLCKVHFGSGFVDPTHTSTTERMHKLLLNKHELVTLAQADMHKKSIIPMTFFLAHGYVKLSLGIGTRRRKHDKRNVLREREMQRASRGISRE